MSATETLSFKNTATRFSVSPQVITRVIAELENELGETLFKRDTRSIRLTNFGENFLPRAIRFLQEEEQLFGGTRTEEDEYSGTVRITLPPSLYSDQVLQKLLIELEPYPHIHIDWRTNFEMLKTVDDQIDIGVRITNSPDEHWIAKKIADLHEPIVATPKLIKKWGKPKDIFDLVEHFPVGYILNPQTGKVWDLIIGQQHIILQNPIVITNDIKSLLPAVLSGRIFAPIMLHDCRQYLENGELEIVLPNNENKIWGIYLYRPYQTITAKRVLLVFEILAKILKAEA
ncbi:LysR family transcriptional regulator [Gallibacterium anatis]|uniref:LysR family transcriptional regulator n=1 Tax=Gallibacterium anatis TaxID=750 RepID=UPI0039FDC841